MARNNKAGGFTRNNNFNAEKKPMSFTDTVTEEENNLEEMDSEVIESEELDIEENTNESEMNERIDNLLGKEKVNKKVLRGFHLEPEISEAIDEATKNKARGAKTKLVNIILEKGLKDNGLL